MAPFPLHWPARDRPEPIDQGDVHLWAVDIDHVRGHPGCLWEPLAADEHARAERFRFDEPRNRFVAARAALRQLLAGYLDLAPEEIEFVYDGYGKPSLDSRRHPLGLHFNVAHSGSLAVIAFTEGCPVGADVECLRTVRQADGISARYFHPDESTEVLQGEVLQGIDEQLIGRFFRCWTRKEAVIKAIGAGLQFPLETFRVPVLIDEPGWVELPTEEKATARRTWLEPFVPCPGYVGAVATLGLRRTSTYQTLVI